jgi:hypothetical protein
MIGVFHTSSYYFLLDDTQMHPNISDHRDFQDYELEARFLRSDKIPNIATAPVGSWFIARLAAMTEGKLGLFNGEEQHVDGGTCCLELLIFRTDQKLVGTLQIQAGEGIVVFGSCSGTENPDLIMEEFVGAFLASPAEVREFCVRVRNPENGSRRVYGYDGLKYLGRLKRRPPQKSESERVADFKESFRSVSSAVIRNMLTSRLEKEAEIAYREILKERGEEP